MTPPRASPRWQPICWGCRVSSRFWWRTTRSRWKRRTRSTGRREPIVSDGYFDSLPAESDLKWAIDDLLAREINPAVATHGGWVELIDVKKNNVYIRLGGGCQGCGAADVTLKQGIEKAIRGLAPSVGEILDTTDHAAGRNPYYSPAK